MHSGKNNSCVYSDEEYIRSYDVLYSDSLCRVSDYAWNAAEIYGVHFLVKIEADGKGCQYCAKICYISARCLAIVLSKLGVML